MLGALMSFEPGSREEQLTTREVVEMVLRNWCDEIGQLVREKVARIGSQSQSQTVLHFRQDAIEVHRASGGLSDLFAQLARNTGPVASQIAELSRVIEKHALCKDVSIALPVESLLRPRLAMPRARRAALTRALGFEVERLSPINPSELYYDFVEIGRGSDNRTAELELRILRRALVDDCVALCHAAGLEVAELRFENDAHIADWQSFPIDRFAFLRALARRFGVMILGSLAVFLVIALLVSAYARTVSGTSVLVEAVVDAGMQAARVERLQQTIARTSSDLALVTRQKQSPLLVSVLAELTQVLPDGTWITDLTVDGSKIRIRGASAAASDLIGLIDRAPQFSNAQFAAPVVRDPVANVDRFDISFYVREPRP